jgi:hypothetical protein
MPKHYNSLLPNSDEAKDSPQQEVARVPILPQQDPRRRPERRNRRGATVDTILEEGE